LELISFSASSSAAFYQSCLGTSSDSVEEYAGKGETCGGCYQGGEFGFFTISRELGGLNVSFFFGLAFLQDYLKIMAETFEQAEDLEVITDLHTLFTMMQTIREFELEGRKEGLG